MLPDPTGTENYTRIPFAFDQQGKYYSDEKKQEYPPQTEEEDLDNRSFSYPVTPSNIFVRLPGDFSPVERMVLQTTGNLQRLLSAYFNAESQIEVVHNELVPRRHYHYGVSSPSSSSSSSDDDDHMDAMHHGGGEGGQQHDINPTKKLDMQFKRRIKTSFDGRYGYEAESVVQVKDAHTLQLLTRDNFGLGQLFSHLRQTPQFQLHAVGRHGCAIGSSFWRDYTLCVPGVIDCYIRETFAKGMLMEEEKEANTHHDHGTVWYAVST